jgi:hypothetical protein
MKTFVVSVRRVIDMESVVVVDHDIEQEMAEAPSWAPGAPTRTQWVVTDVWTLSNGRWRLACRHPELLLARTAAIRRSPSWPRSRMPRRPATASASSYCPGLTTDELGRSRKLFSACPGPAGGATSAGCGAFLPVRRLRL